MYSCCAECGCNAMCQRNHWATHNQKCKLRTAELRDDEALLKDPPSKEDFCPLCFFLSNMPVNIFSFASFPDSTYIVSANLRLRRLQMMVWKISTCTILFHVADRVFVEGASFTPF